MQQRESELREEERRLADEDALVGRVKDALLRVRVGQEDRSDRLRKEERALKECAALLQGLVETLVNRERACMGMEDVVEGRFEAPSAKEKERTGGGVRDTRGGYPLRQGKDLRGREDTNAQRCRELADRKESCKLMERELAEAAATVMERERLGTGAIEDADR